MTYELFKEDPVAFFAVVLVNLIFTLIIYGLFPLVFAKFRKKIITEKKYKRICYLVNGFCCIGGFVYTYGTEALNFAPYILWTSIFVRLGIKILFSKNMIDGYVSKEKHQESNAISVKDSSASFNATGSRLNDINPLYVEAIEQQLSTEKIAYESVQICSVQSSDGTKTWRTLRPDFAFQVVSSNLFALQKKNAALENDVQHEKTKSKSNYRLVICLIAIILALSVGFIAYFNEQNKKLSDAEYWHEFYKEKFLEIEDEYNFYHKNAVVVTSTGSKYHKFSCSHVANRQILIYDIATALVEGYTPCYDCGYSE